MKPETTVAIAALFVAILSVIATFTAPKIAVRVQRELDEEKERQGRKLWIFKTLMSNRATRLNHNYVQALNLIDVEFTDPPEKEIRDAWKELLDHYVEWGAKSPERRQKEDAADLEKSNVFLAEMLMQMAKRLEYNFDKVYIKKGFYYPEGLGNIEKEQHALRGALLNLLSGQGAKLPVAMFMQDFQPLSAQPLQQKNE